MCGRFTLRARPEEVAEHFELDEVPDLAPRHNVAPGQAVATLRADPSGGARVLEERRWGLVPGWADDPAIGSRMINARAETVAEKPAFRSAFRHRPCLVPADGFYEWSQAGSPKQPWLVSRPDGGLFAFAGLYEEWRSEAGEALATCTLVTTEANRVLVDIHPRMPVILAPEAYARWLDPEDVAGRRALLVPYPADRLERRPVSLRVNDVRHDDPSCSAAAAPQPRQESLW